MLVFNSMYGLCMMVLHALSLGGGLLVAQKGSEDTSESRSEDTSESRRRRGGNIDDRRLAGDIVLPDDASHEWLLQLIELDLGWVHTPLGFDDGTCLIGGLVYGLVIFCLSGYMFHAVRSGGSNLPMTSRCFVAFMNLEISIFICLALTKLPHLCEIQAKFYPKLHMECPVLRFTFLQHVTSMTLLAGFGCWIFSSFSYFLAFGFQEIDRPEYADHLEIHDHHAASQEGGSPSQMNMLRDSHTQRLSASPVGSAVHVEPRTWSPLGIKAAAGSGRTSYGFSRSTTLSTDTTPTALETRTFLKPYAPVF